MAVKRMRRMGKSEARAKLLPLVQELARGAGPVEITDRGKVAAILLSAEDYQLLTAQADVPRQLEGQLADSMMLVDDLGKAEEAIAGLFAKSLRATADSV